MLFVNALLLLQKKFEKFWNKLKRYFELPAIFEKKNKHLLQKMKLPKLSYKFENSLSKAHLIKFWLSEI